MLAARIAKHFSAPLVPRCARRCTLFGVNMARVRTVHRTSAPLKVKGCRTWFYVHMRGHSMVAADETSLLSAIRSAGTKGEVELEDVVSQVFE